MFRIDKRTKKGLIAVIFAIAMVLVAPLPALADGADGSKEAMMEASAARGTLDDPIPIETGSEVSEILDASEGQEFTTYYKIELPEDGYIQLVDTPRPARDVVSDWSLEVVTGEDDYKKMPWWYPKVKMGLSAGVHLVRSRVWLQEDVEQKVTLPFTIGFTPESGREDESVGVMDLAIGTSVTGDLNQTRDSSVDYDFYRFSLDEQSKVSVSYSSGARNTAPWEFGPTMPAIYKWKIVVVDQTAFDASAEYPVFTDYDEEISQYENLVQNAVLSNLDSDGNSVWPEGDAMLTTGEVALDAGTYYVCLTANSKLGLPEDYRFTVNAKSLVPSVGDAEIGAVVDQAYTGKAIEPKPTVTLDGTVLAEGVDYELSYKDNVDPGTATVTIKGKGSYKGEKAVSFRIVAPAPYFPDVKAGSWYEKVVYRAASLGLVAGYEDGSFGPDNNITRAQVAVILWRMAGLPSAGSSAKSFPDVKPSAYYAKAVAWASSAGVVNGYADGRFGPDDKVTREQLAVMLANYARKVGDKPVSGSASDYASMKDAGKVADYAQPAVGWCFRNKILSGSDGNVLPKGNATRAQAAKMLVGVYDLVN